MARDRASLVSLSVLIALSACSSKEEPPPSSSDAVSSGAKAEWSKTPEWTSLVFFDDTAAELRARYAKRDFGSGPKETCPGTYPPPRVVLTAAHCLYKPLPASESIAEANESKRAPERWRSALVATYVG